MHYTQKNGFTYILTDTYIHTYMHNYINTYIVVHTYILLLYAI